MNYKLLFNGHHRHFSYRKVLNWYAGLVKPIPQKAPYRHVVQIGDPVLRQQAKLIPINEITSPQTRKLVNQMLHVFTGYTCVGLSAPQIGVALQVLMIEFNQKQMKAFTAEEVRNQDMTLLPLTIVINPKMKVLDYTKLMFSESCESIKGFGADVPRYKAVQLKGYTVEGKPCALEAKGWIARIIQHEVDHLNGRLYTDIMDRKTLSCTCWNVVNENNGKVRLPFGPE